MFKVFIADMFAEMFACLDVGTNDQVTDMGSEEQCEWNDHSSSGNLMT